MCVSVCIFVSFIVFYCTSCIAFFLSFTYTVCVCLSVCLYVSCLCLWALLPDLNKMMMMMMITFKSYFISSALVHKYCQMTICVFKTVLTSTKFLRFESQSPHSASFEKFEETPTPYCQRFLSIAYISNLWYYLQNLRSGAQ